MIQTIADLPTNYTDALIVSLAILAVIAYGVISGVRADRKRKADYERRLSQERRDSGLGRVDPEYLGIGARFPDEDPR